MKAWKKNHAYITRFKEDNNHWILIPRKNVYALRTYGNLYCIDGKGKGRKFPKGNFEKKHNEIILDLGIISLEKAIRISKTNKIRTILII